MLLSELGLSWKKNILFLLLIVTPLGPTWRISIKQKMKPKRRLCWVLLYTGEVPVRKWRIGSTSFNKSKPRLFLQFSIWTFSFIKPWDLCRFVSGPLQSQRSPVVITTAVAKQALLLSRGWEHVLQHMLVSVCASARLLLWFLDSVLLCLALVGYAF